MERRTGRSGIGFIVGLVLCTLAVGQASRPGPADLPTLAIAAADGDLSSRRAALRSIDRIFDAASEEAAASAPDNRRKAAARVRARESLAAKYGDVMRPHLARAIDSKILGGWSAEPRSILDTLWVLRVDAGKVVAALEGLLPAADQWTLDDVTSAIADYDDAGAAGAAALMRIFKLGDHKTRDSARESLESMGARASSVQEALLDEFLETAVSSRPASHPDSAPASRRALHVSERVYLFGPLVKMGAVPEAITRRVIDAIEANPSQQWPAVTYLGVLDPTGKVVIPWLMARIRESGPRSWDAAAAFGGLGPAGAPAVRELIRMLDDPRRSVVADAVDALARIGPAARDAAPALARLHEVKPPGLVGPDLDPGRKELRQQVRQALVSIGADADILFSVLSSALPGEDMGRLEDVCQELDLVPHDLPPPEDLAPALADGGVDLRAHRAAYLIGRHGAAGVPAVPALIAALRSDSSSVRYLAARSLEKIGPDAAAAARPLLMALHSEAQMIGPRAGENVAEINWDRLNRQRASSRQLVRALGAIGPTAREWAPAAKSALATVLGIDDSAAYEAAHEDFDRISPPDRPKVAIVDDPSLAIKESARWIPGNRRSESRPFHADVARDPNGSFRLHLWDIRKPGEWRFEAWTRALFLRLDPAGNLIVTGELWRHGGGPRPTSKKQPFDLTSIRIRPVDLTRAERLEFAYDEEDQWVEVTVPNPFRK